MGGKLQALVGSHGTDRDKPRYWYLPQAAEQEQDLTAGWELYTEELMLASRNRRNERVGQVGKGQVQGSRLAWDTRAFHDLEPRRATLLSLV